MLAASGSSSNRWERFLRMGEGAGRLVPLLRKIAFVLSKLLGRKVSTGKIIHGNKQATMIVKPSALASKVRQCIEKITALLSSLTPPDLVLNRHCAECEFQARCRKNAFVNGKSGGQPWGQPLTYDFSVITEKGVTTSSD